ncbi:MAG TPA: response regulator [Myxococcales bacterium]|jgi:CheY-like chemotaxis protein|nr:response regulator [Myxococcales bacterium]
MSATVLVVDDDSDLREAVADVLADAGYRVLTAEHGRAALDVLRDGRAPDLILLDVMMPVMNGLDFAAQMRMDPRIASIPIIIFTAHADQARVAEAVRAAASLRKPLKVEDLLGVVEAVARGRTDEPAQPGGPP